MTGPRSPDELPWFKWGFELKYEFDALYHNTTMFTEFLKHRDLYRRHIEEESKSKTLHC